MGAVGDSGRPGAIGWESGGEGSGDTHGGQAACATGDITIHARLKEPAREREFRMANGYYADCAVGGARLGPDARMPNVRSVVVAGATAVQVEKTKPVERSSRGACHLEPVRAPGADRSKVRTVASGSAFRLARLGACPRVK